MSCPIAPRLQARLEAIATAVRALGGAAGWTSGKDEEHDSWEFVTLMLTPPQGRRFAGQDRWNTSQRFEWTTDDEEAQQEALTAAEAMIAKPLTQEDYR